MAVLGDLIGLLGTLLGVGIDRTAALPVLTTPVIPVPWTEVAVSASKSGSTYNVTLTHVPTGKAATTASDRQDAAMTGAYNTLCSLVRGAQ